MYPTIPHISDDVSFSLYDRPASEFAVTYPRDLEALRDEDRPKLRERRLEVVVDDEVVVVADGLGFVFCDGDALRDRLHRFGAATLQPLAQHVGRRRDQEHEHG